MSCPTPYCCYKVLEIVTVGPDVLVKYCQYGAPGSRTAYIDDFMDRLIIHNRGRIDYADAMLLERKRHGRVGTHYMVSGATTWRGTFTCEI